MTGRGVALLRRCLIVGGCGAVGDMFGTLLADSGAEVILVDTAGGQLTANITAPGPELRAELADADLVLLAVPERTALAGIRACAAHLRPGTLLADTLSVKQRVVAALHGTPGVEAVSLNPMFAPALGMPGKPVGTVVVHDGPATSELRRLLTDWGAQPVLVDAEQHDRLSAAAQALTHASVLGFGLALVELGLDAKELTAVAPPPNTTLLAMLARIASGTPEVYWDVQVANPDAAPARAALAAGIRRVAELVENDEEDGFSEALDTVRDFFGEELTQYRDTCAHLFTHLPRKP